ncbi:hypothetical protein CXU19_01370 [Akkermansia muciniphila]|nr:hypothetical protein CXU19_01370 [Akkermansia muciniphila]PNC40253.1 hypothetical protein CXU20_02685 [Akkermansia muciniphila]
MDASFFQPPRAIPFFQPESSIFVLSPPARTGHDAPMTRLSPSFPQRGRISVFSGVPNSRKNCFFKAFPSFSRNRRHPGTPVLITTA